MSGSGRQTTNAFGAGVIAPARSTMLDAHALAPAAVLLGIATAVLVGSGATPLEVARLGLYESLFVLLPGFALYRVLFREDARLSRQLTFSWAFGYALEVLAFTATAAAGLRPLFMALPLVGVVMLVAGRHGRAVGKRLELPPANIQWPFVGVCGLALGYLWLTYFLETPLPGTVDAVTYYVDTVHQLALAGEALHRWPIADPHVAGEPFAYYHFPFIHIAAIAQVTGIALPTVVFRLFIVPLFIAIAVQSYYVGVVASRGSRAAGVLAAACLLLAGELDLSRTSMYPFLNSFFFGLIYSPSFLLGLVFFLAVTAALATRAEVPRIGVTRYVSGIVLLLIVCTGTKGPMVPILVAGMAGVAAWVAVRERRIDWTLVLLAAVGTSLIAALYLFAQGRATSIVFQPLARVPTATSLPMPMALTLGAVALLGIRAAGLVWAVPAAWREPAGPAAWLLILGAAGIVPAYLFEMGTSQFYFLWYACAAASALSGAALVDARHWRSLRGRIAACVVVALFAIGLCDLPLDYVDRLQRVRAGEPVHSQANRNLPRGLLEGLQWIRAHTPADAVLAVNNYLVGPGDFRYFYYAAFSERRTFLEGWMYSDRTHAVGYADAALGRTHPFPDRKALNDRLFVQGDLTAAAALRSRGVTHLVVDRVHGPAPDALHTVGSRVFANADVEVYSLR